MTEMVALRAVELISRSLPVAFVNGKDIAARTDMMLGRLLAGMSFSNASTCIVHGIGQTPGRVLPCASRPIQRHVHS